ncbi:hypothetical protein GWI33_011728 [Rhynchophorus ferrugineus]|uniref:Uncharacterized protein n=1 Tax=Rhynchophorus ferrugineus TaxID=354439 RepID=A0A834MJ47_RHYFE|nr:hypothetical protein GWI33_011728 [Rhynchophorus ferrugineus]
MALAGIVPNLKPFLWHPLATNRPPENPRSHLSQRRNKPAIKRNNNYLMPTFLLRILRTTYGHCTDIFRTSVQPTKVKQKVLSGRNPVRSFKTLDNLLRRTQIKCKVIQTDKFSLKSHHRLTSSA